MKGIQVSELCSYILEGVISNSGETPSLLGVQPQNTQFWQVRDSSCCQLLQLVVVQISTEDIKGMVSIVICN